MTWVKSWSVGLPIVLLVPGLAIAQLDGPFEDGSSDTKEEEK